MEKTVKALGRGLSGLLQTPAGEPPAPSQAGLHIQEIPLGQIVPGSLQTRRSFDESALRELAESIKQVGVIQPVVVRARPDAATYELISGERRWRAAKLAGLAVIPALVRNENDLTTLQVSLIENVQRAELNPVERAKGYALFRDTFQLSAEQLAEKTGEDRSTVANFLRLLDLPPEVLHLLQEGQLTAGHARALLGLPDDEARYRLARLAVDKGLSVRALEKTVTLMKQGHPPSPFGPQPQPPAAKQLAEQISAQIGLKVRVRLGTRKGTGRILFKFNTLDEFDRLMSALNVKLE